MSDSANIQLTAGICARLINSEEDQELWNSGPTVQFLSVKKANAPSTGVDRYRIIVSDGEKFTQAMLATQLNEMVENEVVKKNSIVVIDKLSCNFVQSKRLIIILDMHVVCQTSEKIGSPTSLEQAAPSASDSPASAPASGHASVAAPSTPAARQQPQQSSGRHTAIYPIEGLSPYQNKWTIKARVTQKSDIRTYSNQRGEGKFFNVTLMDESSEIRGTAWNNVVDDLYEKLQEGKVYYISKARVNLAKKKFSNLANEYELMLERSTEIEECLDSTGLPANKYSFVELSALENIVKDSTCDVIGVVKEVGTLGEIITKATNKSLTKRELTLVDRSGFSVRLTLWGKQAEQWNANDQPIVAFKGVKVGDYGGKSLSMFSTSTMVINPDIPEAHVLRGWYDSAGAEESFQSHTSSMSGGGAAGPFNRTELRTLYDVKDSQLGTTEGKSDYFTARATVVHIKTDNLAYPACPEEGCNKKVTEGNEGWRCEKCNRSWEKPDHRYMVQLSVADYTGSMWMTGFNDTGLAVFGMPAGELLDIKERDDAKFNVIMHRANINTWNFTCRARQETFNESTRMRYSISRIAKPDYREEAGYLIDLLNGDWAK